MFIRDLLSAYLKYAKKLNFTTELLASKESFVIVLIKGDKAEQYFRDEIGKHCVQRIPPTENRGRTHTSIISVSVIPLKKNIKYKMLDADLEIQTTKGSGPGGQHRNKTDSAVRMKHLPTGLQVFIDGRSQHSNKQEAHRILSGKVSQFYEEQNDIARNDVRCSQIGNRKRSDKIRTYNFKKNRAVDHRLGTKTSRIYDVMNGRFDLLK